MSRMLLIVALLALVVVFAALPATSAPKQSTTHEVALTNGPPTATGMVALFARAPMRATARDTATMGDVTGADNATSAETEILQHVDNVPFFNTGSANERTTSAAGYQDYFYKDDVPIMGDISFDGERQGLYLTGYIPERSPSIRELALLRGRSIYLGVQNMAGTNVDDVIVGKHEPIRLTSATDDAPIFAKIVLLL